MFLWSEELQVIEIQQLCIRQSTDSKSTQPDFGAPDAPRSRSGWCKSAAEPVRVEELMERLSTSIAASLCRDLACEFSGALQTSGGQTEVDGLG